MKGCMKVIIVGALIAVVVLVGSFVLAQATAKHRGDIVTLQSKEWNHGKVHIWNNLNEDATTTRISVPDNTPCTILTDAIYETPLPPHISYYRVDCAGVIGFVETEQVK